MYLWLVLNNIENGQLLLHHISANSKLDKKNSFILMDMPVVIIQISIKKILYCKNICLPNVIFQNTQ